MENLSEELSTHQTPKMFSPYSRLHTLSGDRKLIGMQEGMAAIGPGSLATGEALLVPGLWEKVAGSELSV